MGTHTARERGNPAVTGGLTENELIQIRDKAQATQNQLILLTPYFDELESLLHKKWAELPLDDGASAKTVKFQLYAVRKLRELMIGNINQGKIAAKKLEGV